MGFPEKVQGAIFDVDDTLLDNQAAVDFGTLHEVSRFEAIRHVARKYNLSALASLTHEENLAAFITAKTHSLPGAVWNVLYQKGFVATEDLDPKHELLNEIVLLKDKLHAVTLRQYGQAVLGAAEFVSALATKYEIGGSMAIASSAIRRDINIFLDELTDLRTHFPKEHIVAYEDIPPGLGKPHPEPFNRAFESLGLRDENRSSVVAFEDDPRGVQSAKKAGLFVCAITTRFTADHPDLVASGPDLTIESYAQAARLLEGGK